MSFWFLYMITMISCLIEVWLIVGFRHACNRCWYWLVHSGCSVHQWLSRPQNTPCTLFSHASLFVWLKFDEKISEPNHLWKCRENSHLYFSLFMWRISAKGSTVAILVSMTQREGTCKFFFDDCWYRTKNIDKLLD